jgi:hypothetical protein
VTSTCSSLASVTAARLIGAIFVAGDRRVSLAS